MRVAEKTREAEAVKTERNITHGEKDERKRGREKEEKEKVRLVGVD